MRKFLFIVMDERKSTDVMCPACLHPVKIALPAQGSVKSANTIWGISAVAIILLGLATFLVLSWANPAIPEWIWLVVGAIIAFSPLPIMEAIATRPLVRLQASRAQSPGHVLRPATGRR